jgi:succinate dehydrogenase / fumarate reductase iron-sulfur subunit
VNEGEVVLDVIHRLQATQAGDLAVRWNCKAGKCGSCSAEINGRPRLMCMTRMSTFGEDDTVTVTPLRTFPVIRDLVTDVSYNYDKAAQIPAFTPRPRDADGNHRMQQVDVERSQEFRKCIECYLCQDTCHVIRDHEENKAVFAGPRFLIRLAELDMHPLDVVDRRNAAQEEFGLGYCNITKCCSEVCPEGIHLTDNGIIPLKERVVDRKYDPSARVTWLGSKIGGARRPSCSSPSVTPVAEKKTSSPLTRSSVVSTGRGRSRRRSPPGARRRRAATAGRCSAPPMHLSAQAEMTPSGVPPMPHSRSTPVPSRAPAIAPATSPSVMRRIRAPASRISWMPSSWRGRSSMTTITSRTSQPLRLATLDVSASGAVEVEQVGDVGPVAIFSM